MLRSDDDQSLRDTELDIRDALIDIATYLGEIVKLLSIKIGDFSKGGVEGKGKIKEK